MLRDRLTKDGTQSLKNAWTLTALRIAALVIVTAPAWALEISDYYSPWNRRRPVRSETRYIVLHTTEGPGKGSLNKIRANGEAHYFVAANGHVYRIIDKKRIAAHAGRSMWNGKSNLDAASIGVEVAGYHNRDITAAQYKAVRELVSQLQSAYGIRDESVLCHSMVAYGAPNRWHRHAHRGRKRCGMLFARRSVRLRLGLTRQPLNDPDVKAGRLIVADRYLEKVLYGSAIEQNEAVVRFTSADANTISATRSAWDIARDKYASAGTIYILPDGRPLRGDQIEDWKAMKPGTRVILSGDHRSNELDGFRPTRIGATPGTSAARSPTTIYFLPDGTIRRGDQLDANAFKNLPEGTKMLVGYTHGGYVTQKRSAFDICGKKWNYPSTFYRFPDGKIRTGATVDERRIPQKTLVFFRN